MDSLTQIVLGAAVGEVILGKKIGNKAMLWGAIAGTIPDLDVYQSLIFDGLRANELHRGFSHSILFSIIFAPLFSWLIRTKEKWTLVSVITLILGYPFITTFPNAYVSTILLVVWGFLMFLVFRNKFGIHTASKKDWTKLFFWSLITHPLLDCHTTWGTQLLWPLPYKLAWNNIFVLDPLYTVPFLMFVLIAMFFHRQSSTRRILNWTGIALSSLYMIWSLGAKWYTYGVFQENLKSQGISYSRLMTVPTPANTFLWSATADADTAYYTGLYSLWDADNIVNFNHVRHNHHLINDLKNEEVVSRLNKLSKNWYVISKDSSNTRTYNDARFGPMYLSDGNPRYGFGYQLLEKGGKWVAKQGDPPMKDGKAMLDVLWNRVWGD
ncbi:metal-dependent hydrolase [Bacteroidia bacterium]|nr:metal-dependent hydrolase [Bacteroidia bacterium]